MWLAGRPENVVFLLISMNCLIANYNSEESHVVRAVFSCAPLFGQSVRLLFDLKQDINMSP